MMSIRSRFLHDLLVLLARRNSGNIAALPTMLTQKERLQLSCKFGLLGLKICLTLAPQPYLHHIQRVGVFYAHCKQLILNLVAECQYQYTVATVEAVDTLGYSAFMLGGIIIGIVLTLGLNILWRKCGRAHRLVLFSCL